MESYKEEKMEQLDDALIVAIIFVSFVVVIKILSDNRIRRAAIDKGVLGEDLKYLYGNRIESYVPSALKWGFVLIGIGLAFFIGQFVPGDDQGVITIGSMFALSGLGLVIYYLIARNMAAQEEEQQKK
jgi:hypothetical protein